MKKAFLIAIALVLSASLYAQYRGTYWGETSSELCSDKHMGAGTNRDHYIVEFEESARIMGEATKVRYFTQMAKLKYIGYTIDWTQEREDKLIENLSSGLYKIELISKGESFNFEQETTETMTPEEREEIEKRNKLIAKDHLTYIFVEDLEGYLRATMESVTGEYFQPDKGLKKEGDAKLIKANYGGSTDIYVYSNVFKNRLTVIYTEAVQDF